MKLFEVNEFGEAVVNKAWISLIPEFQNLFRLPGDRKVSYTRSKGKMYITYIYFMHDFSSPIRDYDEKKRKEEALKFAGMTPQDLNEHVRAAEKLYVGLQLNKCRALKSYRAAQVGLDKMDEYFENIDFTQTDKQGKLLYTPNQYIDNLAKMNKAYDELEKLSKRVETEMAQTSVGIRGAAELGDKELRRSKDNVQEETETDWAEEVQEENVAPAMTDLLDILNKH